MLKPEWLSPVRRVLFDPLLNVKSPLIRYWKELEKSQYLPEEELRARQWHKLKELLRFVWENNDFYRARLEKAGISPAMVRCPKDMLRIPVLAKSEIRRSSEEMLSRGFARSELMQFKTGGSTGKALEIYLTEECSELRNACARRHDRWSGWEVGEAVAAIWGNPPPPVTLAEKLRERLLSPHLYLDTMSISEESVRTFAFLWPRVRPTLVFGHAHSIYLLARYLRELKIQGLKPRGILSTSMMLLPRERATIEEVFGVKVTDRYGCEEVSLIASECEKHEGMHLNIEHLFVEFLDDDGGWAAPGEPGRIVVTDLLNRAMPFIRYQVEDVGVPSSRRCSCGRGLPLIEQVTGRVADFLVKPDGSRVAGISLIENTLTSIPGIDQMQIVQESLESIRIRMVAGPEYAEAAGKEVVEYFRTLFGTSVTVELELVPSVPPEKNGKYRFSICRVEG